MLPGAQPAPFQSSSRPYGLDIVGQVMQHGSDGLSADFSDNWLPAFEYHGRRMSATLANPPQGFTRLGDAPITLPVAHDVRAYFVGEGAGFRNSLGFNTAGLGIQSGDPLLIFPNASTPNDWLSSNHEHNANNPMLPGDFVELGFLGANTTVDFFLIANGGHGGNNRQVLSSDSSLNPDSAVHMVAFAVAESPYLLVGFEDRSAPTDWDYNDAVFAVYIGEQNVTALITGTNGNGVPVPEPAFLWLTVAACGGWLLRAQRQRRKGRVS